MVDDDRIGNSSERGFAEKDNSETDQYQLLSTTANTSGLKVECAGQVVPQQAVFDLKTRSLKSKPPGIPSGDEFLPRLWVNQTCNLVLAYHTRGRFESRDIHIVDVRDHLTRWEAENATTLSKLGVLLHRLIEVGKRAKINQFEIRRIEKRPLEVWSEVPGWSALPKDLKSLWEADGDKDDIAGPAQPGMRKTGSCGAGHRNAYLTGEEDDNSDYDEDYIRF